MLKVHVTNRRMTPASTSNPIKNEKADRSPSYHFLFCTSAATPATAASRPFSFAASSSALHRAIRSLSSVVLIGFVDHSFMPHSMRPRSRCCWVLYAVTARMKLGASLR